MHSPPTDDESLEFADLTVRNISSCFEGQAMLVIAPERDDAPVTVSFIGNPEGVERMVKHTLLTAVEAIEKDAAEQAPLCDHCVATIERLKRAAQVLAGDVDQEEPPTKALH